MRDRFFEVENCDRCGKMLNGCRIMSMYNQDVLCMDCKDKETQREDYSKAVEADHEQIRRGNYNFRRDRAEKTIKQSTFDGRSEH